MRVIIVSLLLWWAATSSTCGTTDQDPDEQVRVIVLCDASNSTTLLNSKAEKDGRLEKLKEYVKKIPKWYPFESEVFYYPVSENGVSAQLGSKVKYDVVMRSQLEPEKRRVDSTISAIATSLNEVAAKTKNSCILLSINRCFSRFFELQKTSPTKEYKNELIIISDMLENCYAASGEEIRMSVMSNEQLRKAISVLENQPASYDMHTINLTVKVLVNSPGLGTKFDIIKEAWTKWFYKAGIKEGNLIFYTEEPNIEENPLLNK